MERRKFREEFIGDQQAACGRTVPEQVAEIKDRGVHALPHILRQQLLRSLGIKARKEQSENVVIFGCYKPFTSPDLIRDYLKLFDILDIDYTWMEKEYCCGFPIVGQSSEYSEEVREFNQANAALAKQKMAKQLIFCCIGCATASKHTVNAPEIESRYVLDVLLDVMENRKYQITPTTIGYFEGCHSWFNYNFPEGKQNWARYRAMLDRIEGLTVVDLPRNLCCKRSGDRIFQKAEELQIDCIVAPCIDCHKNLYDMEGDGVKVMSYPSLLLRCLGH